MFTRLQKVLGCFGRLPINTQLRAFSTGIPSRIKEIQTTKTGNSIIIEAITVESPRSAKVQPERCQTKFCPECTLGLKISHTDILILSQYVRSDGCMLPRRITGLCGRQQRRISIMVAMAQKAGLVPNLAPEYSKKDPKKRYQWKKLNKYFDEFTIRW